MPQPIGPSTGAPGRPATDCINFMFRESEAPETLQKEARKTPFYKDLLSNGPYMTPSLSLSDKIVVVVFGWVA